ncbi:hypothetical protein SAMN05444714_0732 [Yoonia litorea]|uniref:Uncharacterized protein n=1 Tax=Yoonia litorea TaxID=1123755 RepID=A0A1I6LNF8_9RHOB|nr:hypothetical protein SAMN05444714_0732 [Yoonia litorea]
MRNTYPNQDKTYDLQTRALEYREISGIVRRLRNRFNLCQISVILEIQTILRA